MDDPDATLRSRLERYLAATDAIEVPGVVGICLTGSLAAGYADDHSDLDLTVVVEGEPPTQRLGNALVPDDATVQRRDPTEQCSFDWEGGHLDVEVVRFAGMRAAQWDLTTRWEYDSAEVLVDPDGRVTSRLTAEVPFDDGERATLAADHAAELLFEGQWNVQKGCLRGKYGTAHRAATTATEAALTLLFLREGEFRPREKWLQQGLTELVGVDDDVRSLAWEATRVVEQTPEDVHRRVVALRSLWGRIRRSLLEQSLVDPADYVWEADPEVLCGLA
jgi:predicted nucleotidyltransferase